MHVLVCEDDELIASGIVAGLTAQGFTVERVATAGAARAMLKAATFDIMVLDLGLPDEDGLKLLQQQRSQGLEIPVLILTARDSVTNRVDGLQAVDAVGHRVPCGQDQHRDFQALAALLLQQLEAVFIRQAEVKHHDVEGGRLEHRACSARRGHALDGKTLGGEAGHNAAGDQFVVFTDQYVHGEPFMKDGGD